MDTVFSGAELCHSQGWPVSIDDACEGASKLSSTQLQDLSGNSFSLLVFALVRTTYWLNPWVLWWQKKVDGT